MKTIQATAFAAFALIASIGISSARSDADQNSTARNTVEASSFQCMTDDGYGRRRPCDAP